MPVRFMLRVSTLALVLGSLAPCHALADELVAETGQTPDSQVAEIVVTGQNVRRTIQATDTSVAVLTPKRLQDEHIQSLFDVIRRTPNMNETFGDMGFTLRGITNASLTGGVGSLATVYVDGAPMADRALVSGPMEMWDIGQVEVFRGPQSTLQGRNALAGAVIIRSKDPTFTLSGAARASVTDNQDRTLALALSGPLIDYQLAWRLAYEDKEGRGIIRNPTRGVRSDASQIRTLRAKVLVTPAALPDLTVRGTFVRNEKSGPYLYTYSSTNHPDYFNKRYDYSDYPNRVYGDTDIATLEAEYALSEGLTLTGIVSKTTNDFDSSYDLDFTSAKLGWGDQGIKTEVTTGELRLNFNTGAVQGLVGLFASEQEAKSEMDTLTSVPLPTPLLTGLLMQMAGLSQPAASQLVGLYAQAMPNIPVDFKSRALQSTRSKALFADVTWDVTPKLHLTGGFRMDQERFGVGILQTSKLARAYPDPALYGPYAAIIRGLNGAIAQQIASASATTPPKPKTFKAFLPKFAVRYDWTSDLSTALTVQRGYRSGGSEINTARSLVVAFDPEYTWNTELSLRSVWLDGAARFNANLFHVDWTAQQVQVNLGLNTYDNQTVNAGKSRLSGFEAEWAHRVSPQFDYYANIGHVRTRFGAMSPREGQARYTLTGAEFPHAPRWTAAVGGTWRNGQGLMVNLNASHRTAMFDNAQNQSDPEARHKSRTLLNGRVGYETSLWGVFLDGSNLTNAKHSYYRDEKYGEVLGQPRRLSISLEARW